MERPNEIINPNRWLATRVVDLGKVPMKFFLIWGLYSAVAIIAIMVYLFAFTSGIVFGVPNDFAVDNEERINLINNSGVYVVKRKFYAILPPNRDGGALSVSRTICSRSQMALKYELRTLPEVT